ncbi:hypothetical protein EI94DRAFT_1700950 [Lactarius quietus]|nr:hypothetical protein EI94DRAFT_1704097 [Lactarius quietus]KAF8267508.1 hypothetical protein EI94DRAFT_1700950 [Lactarius quietus]
MTWLKFLLDLEHIPPTINISWANPETSVPWTYYATPLCNLFAQLGLRGVSVLIASGDNGVCHGNCQDGAGSVRFYTMFPASCKGHEHLWQRSALAAGEHRKVTVEAVGTDKDQASQLTIQEGRSPIKVDT